jgi:hypothetical protein
MAGADGPELAQVELEARVDALEEQVGLAERRHNREGWGEIGRTVWLAILSIVLIVVVAQVRESNAHRLERAELKTCERLKVTRHQANVANFIEWKILGSVVVRERALARSDAPLKTRAVHQRSADQLTALISQLRFTPQTNCAQAVGNPDGYKRPEPLPFDRLPPGAPLP